MLTLFEALILGLVQGLTEFLPVSSSGHLVLGGALLGVKSPGAGFEIFAHAGTLLAILLHYRRDLIGMASSAVHLRADEHGRLLLLVALGSIPAAAVGFGLGSRLEDLFDHPALAAAMLLVTGTFLLLLRLAPAGGGSTRTDPSLAADGTWIRPEEGNPVRPRSALVIGIAQAIAILPGISRSGSTIGTALFLGVDRSRAARFSFLLAVPALAGAALLKSIDVVRAPIPEGELTAWLVGAAAAFGSGWLALRWLLKLVDRGRLDRFGFYCLAVGMIALVVLLF